MELEAQAAQAHAHNVEKELAHHKNLMEQLSERTSQHEQQLVLDAEKKFATFNAEMARKVDHMLSENTSLQSTLTNAKYESGSRQQELLSQISELQHELKTISHSLHER